MNEQKFIELAARYVSGTASADEVDLLQALLKEQMYADLFRKVNDVWLAGGKAALHTEYDTDLGLNRLVILEFPSVEAARTWYGCAEYREVMKLRHASAASHLVLAEGFDG